MALKSERNQPYHGIDIVIASRQGAGNYILVITLGVLMGRFVFFPQGNNNSVVLVECPGKDEQYIYIKEM